MHQISKETFDRFYDRYSPMVYDMAHQMTTSTRHAEQIIISVFKKAYDQNIIEKTFPSPCMTLIKIVLATAHTVLNNGIGKPNFKLQQLNHTPLLQHLLHDQSSIASYCSECGISKEQAAINLRAEIASLGESLSKNSISV